MIYFKISKINIEYSQNYHFSILIIFPQPSLAFKQQNNCRTNIKNHLHIPAADLQETFLEVSYYVYEAALLAGDTSNQAS